MTDSSFPISTHKQPPNGPFTCNHCSKSFSSTQALGGHQNAHRSEKRNQKRPQKAPFIKKKQGKYKPDQNGNPKLKIYLDRPFREPRKLIGPNFRVGPFVPFAIGPSCKCSEKVDTSWAPIHVARYRLSKTSDSGVVVNTNSPQVKILGEEKEDDSNQGLDLSLKL